jgi:hypothetical protein
MELGKQAARARLEAFYGGAADAAAGFPARYRSRQDTFFSDFAAADAAAGYPVLSKGSVGSFGAAKPECHKQCTRSRSDKEYCLSWPSTDALCRDCMRIEPNYSAIDHGDCESHHSSCASLRMRPPWRQADDHRWMDDRGDRCDNEHYDSLGRLRRRQYCPWCSCRLSSLPFDVGIDGWQGCRCGERLISRGKAFTRPDSAPPSLHRQPSRPIGDRVRSGVETRSLWSNDPFLQRLDSSWRGKWRPEIEPISWKRVEEQCDMPMTDRRHRSLASKSPRCARSTMTPWRPAAKLIPRHMWTNRGDWGICR